MALPFFTSHLRGLRSRLGRRILGWVLFVSTLVTTLNVFFQLGADYLEGKRDILSRLDLLERSSYASLAQSIWNVDKPTLEIQLNGMLSYSEVLFAVVEDPEGFRVSSGDETVQTSGVKKLPLKLTVDGMEREVGTLTVGFTFTPLYAEIENRAAVILLGQGLKTFAVSFAILAIVWSLVTRRLARVMTGLNSVERFDSRARKAHRTGQPEDEIDELEMAVVEARERERLAQGELRRLLEESRDSVRQREELLALVSHELRTPLMPLTSWVELLLMNDEDPQHRRRAYREIQSSAANLTSLLASILDSEKSSRGGLRMVFETLDFTGLVKEVCSSQGISAAQKGLKLRLRACEEGVVVRGDSTALRRLLGHLLENAIKFSRPGGDIDVRLMINAERGRATLSVTDYGEGIEPENLKLIFDKFYQVHRGMSRKYGGLGLGLHLAREIASGHLGSLWVESEGLGKGATFVFEVPMVV